MRVIAIAVGALLLGALGVVAWATVFRPPPAATRLAGVDVSVVAFTVDDLGGDRHRLTLTAAVTSVRDLDECVAFALDEPFAARRLRAVTGDCVHPRVGRTTVQLLSDALTGDDLRFSSHTLVWGVAGGRCGPILTLFGVCVVDQAGTAALQLPSTQVLPSFGRFGSFGPIGPIFSFPPP